MWRVTIKGILAHKIRFLLTGVAVILGVSFIAGTLVLTATISKTFDGLFANIYANTDAVVRAEANFKGAFNAGRGRIDASLLPVVRKTSGCRGGRRRRTGLRAGDRQERRSAQRVRPGRAGARVLLHRRP